MNVITEFSRGIFSAFHWLQSNVLYVIGFIVLSGLVSFIGFTKNNND